MTQFLQNSGIARTKWRNIQNSFEIEYLNKATVENFEILVNYENSYKLQCTLQITHFLTVAMERY